MLRRALFVAGLVGLCAPAARADVKVHPVFSDNVVLQQKAKAPVWGKADPDEKVTVTLAGEKGNVEGSATADKDGNWKVILETPAAGVGFTLTAKGKNEVAFKNVAVGEVWVCSGQSNMEWSVNASETPDKIKAASKNPKVRLFTVQKRTAAEPIQDPNDLKHFTKWVECGPDTVGGFSAVGYFFGANLQKNLPNDTPIGLIHTSWGGTPAEAWTSLEALEAVPELKHYAQKRLDTIKAIEDAKKNFTPEKAKAAFEAAMEKYNADLAKWKDAADKAKAENKPVPQQPKKPVLASGPPTLNPHTPASLYNAMIYPLLPYAVKGSIWYQGESNAGRAFEYRTLMGTLITDWRAKFATDLPYMIVQLAPFMAINKEPMDSAWAELREAQYLQTVKLKNVGLSVITDVGDEKDIHPRPKQPVGDRLAIAARAIVYGEKIEPIGPVFKELKVEGEKAILSFDHLGGGLEAKGSPLTGFTICGEDKKFHNATAEIKGDTVVVSSDKVAKPVAVRFGWANYPVVNLWSKAGLPAVPFRTDDFPITTGPKK